MRIHVPVLFALVALAMPAAADDHLGDPQMISQCHDGQPPSGKMPCDADEHADGTCTFGKRDGAQEAIPIGRSTKMLTSTGIVAEYTCVKPLPPPSSEESESGSSAGAVSYSRTQTKISNKKITNKKMTNSKKVVAPRSSGARGIGAKILAAPAAAMP